MGKDNKEETGFGFKDKAKAEETLKLLESHDPNYRRLTVRGLLGRAKRVLSLTKAEDKIKNIKEAMQVFEDWLAELEKNKEKPEKKKAEKKRKRSEEKESSSDVEMEDKNKEKKELPSETVPGLGFKNKEAAENTLKQLEGRDPDYQQLAIKALIKSAQRVLSCTRDETKLANIKDSITIFEKFLDDFATQNMGRQNNPYIDLEIVNACVQLAGDNISEEQRSFISAYSSVRGQYKRLRTVPSGDDTTWDITRNRVLKDLKEKHASAELFTEQGEPTAEHLSMLLWAYSPQPARVKRLARPDEPPGKRRAHSPLE